MTTGVAGRSIMMVIEQVMLSMRLDYPVTGDKAERIMTEITEQNEPCCERSASRLSSRAS
jgi:hypothetical protein